MGQASERDRLLYKIAKAYYYDDETQGIIAERFGVSRVKVCRLLKQARDEGVVTIAIRSPSADTVELERELASAYGIKEAIVADSSGAESAAAVGGAAAAYFTRTIQGGETVALTWGAGLLAFVNALEPFSVPEIRVVQMLGGLGDADADVHGAELARRMAQRLGCRPRILQSPGIVGSASVRRALLADAQIAETLSFARKADVAFVGLGVLDSSSLLRGASIISASELETLAKAGAVGDIALRFYDAEGNAVRAATDDRVVGLSLEEIRSLPRVVAIAWGTRKIAAIRGALKGGLVSVLVTDREAAEGLVG